MSACYDRKPQTPRNAIKIAADLLTKRRTQALMSEAATKLKRQHDSIEHMRNMAKKYRKRWKKIYEETSGDYYNDCSSIGEFIEELEVFMDFEDWVNDTRPSRTQESGKE